MNRQNKTINIHEKTEFSLKQRTPDLTSAPSKKQTSSRTSTTQQLYKTNIGLGYGNAMQSTEDEDS